MKKKSSRKPAKTGPKAVSRDQAKFAAAVESVADLKGQLEEKVGLLSATNRQLKRKIFDLYTIFEISRNFNAVLDYQTLLDSFIFTCLGQVGALKGTIFLKRDGQSDRFYPAKSKGSGDLPGPDQYFSADSQLARYLTKLNRPSLTGDLLKSISTTSEQEILQSFESGIVVPLIYQTRLSGIFAMADKISGREFNVDDIEFLSILGNQIAVAIENARLYEGERNAIQQLRAAQQQLLYSERLAALGEMSAKIAHEVNNPLGIIKNYVALLQRSVGKDRPEGEYAEVVGQEINRIADIVKQLLDFHRPRSVTRKRVDVASVIDEVLVLMERQLASSRIEVRRDFDVKGAHVQGSPENLKQVVLNLVINARDAMSEGGCLTVSVGAEQGEVIIGIADTGPGISPELIPRIFEPFFTTKEPGRGTGLGLSVCYGIIRNHNGSITFKNLESGGCFEIRLPAGPEKE
ncbi:MAG TPA: ATP-binding protein [Acidobacteriota bacterium]|nr:ATP-binding protein [Acidobacteriota bacterium]